MLTDDNGARVAVTLDDAQRTILAVLTGARLSSDADDVSWVSYAAEYGQDRGERVLYLEITSPSGVCESFQLSLTRDEIG